MDPFESYIHSFIIKIWLEKTTGETGQVTWRGHITHVPSGKRRYIKNLEGITAFIVPYLERMGAKVGVRWRLERDLARWKQNIIGIFTR